MNKVLALVAVCLLAASLLGCTGAPAPNRSKDFPLTVLDSIFVPGILQTTTVDQAASGNSFLVLKVRMENKGASPASVGASGFKVVIDADSYPCDAGKDTDNDPRFPGQDFGSTSISARSYVEGWAVFELPVSLKSLNTGELRFSDRELLGDGVYSKVHFSPSSAKRFENISARLSLEVKSMTITYKFTAKDGAVATPSPENLFAVCDIVITNNARTRVRLSVTPDNIVFVSSDKTEYLRGAIDTAPDTLTPLKNQDIQPSASARGTIIYEVLAEDSYINKVVLKYSALETYSCVVSKSNIDIESNHAPVAKITGNDTGFIDTDLPFDANASTDPDGDPLTFFWDFGDTGTSSGTSSEPRPAHRYAKTGSYTILLKVKDIGGMENTATRSIKISHYFSFKESGHGLETDVTSYYKDAFYVDVNMTNNANKTWSIPSSLFRLKTSDGAFFDWVGDDGKDPNSLGPKASASWRVYFTVPAGKIPVSITFDDAVTVLF